MNENSSEKSLTCLLSLNCLLPEKYRVDVTNKTYREIKSELESKIKYFTQD